MKKSKYIYSNLKFCNILIITFLFFYTIFAQSDNVSSKRYTRKSISVVPTIILRSKNFNITEKHKIKINNYVKKSISLNRFEYNNLPDKILKKYFQTIKSSNPKSIDDIQKILKKTVFTTIRKILELNMEKRAQNLITETQKNKFIRIKAKETGITSRQLDKILNSAYIAAPVFTSIYAKTGNKYVIRLDGGIIWYRIVYSNSKYYIKYHKTISTSSYGQAMRGLDYNYLGYDSYKKYAFETALKNYTRNLQAKIKSIIKFSLSNTIQYVSGNSVKFNLGSDQDVRVDDRYKIFEYSKNRNGNVNESYKGFFLVTDVVNNENDEYKLSKGRLIHNHDVSRGMRIKEYSRIGLEYSYGLSSRPILYVNDEGYHFKLDKEYIARSIFLQCNYNIGRPFLVSQLFFQFNIFMGGIPGKPRLAANDINKGSFGIFLGGEIGTFKKIYIGPLFLGAGIGLGEEFFDYTILEPNEYNLNSIPDFYSYYSGLGEIALSPKMNIGIKLKYRNYYRDLPDNYSEDNVGPVWDLYINYIPQESFFDPLSYIFSHVGITFK